MRRNRETTRSRVRLIEISASKKYSLNGGPFGSKLVSRDYQPSGVPVIRGVNLPNYSQFSYEDFVFVSEEKANDLLPNNAHPGDLIFTQRGTLGQVGLIPKDSPYKRFVISQSQMKLTVDKTKAEAEFLYYYFRQPDTVQKIQNLALSSGIPHINLDILRNFEVLLPSLPNQRKIADILSNYDRLIENNTRRIKILEEMAQLIYREWFVNFRFPGYENVSIVKSERGLIPQGWKALTLGDVIELAYGKALKASDRRGGSVSVYGSSGIVGHHDQCLVKAPGIVVGRKGNVGSVFWSDEDFFPIDTVFYVQSEVCLHYIYYNLQTQNFINNDAAVPGLNRNQAYSLPFILPTSELLQKFQAFVSSIFDQLKNLRQKNQNLRQTRDLILPKLISGEIDVEAIDTSDLEAIAA